MDFINENASRDIITTLKRWLENKNAGKSFSKYLIDNGYMTIGIMDAGEIGKILYEELKKSEVEVKWFVDRNAEGIGQIDGKPVRLLRDVFLLEKVDIICVSPIYDYEKVYSYLVEHDPTICTLSLRDAAYEM